jgi:serine/threonine-protein kinase
VPEDKPPQTSSSDATAVLPEPAEVVDPGEATAALPMTPSATRGQAVLAPNDAPLPPSPIAPAPTASPAPTGRTSQTSSPAARTGSGSSGTAATAASTVRNPLDALDRDEVLRTRRFCLIGCLISLGGAASIRMLPGDPTMSLLLMAAIVVSFGAVLFLFLRTADPIRFRHWTTLIGWYVPTLGICCSVPFFGSFSPVAIVLVLAIYFIGVGKSSRLALIVYLTCAGAQGLISTLVITQTTRDTGVVKAMPLSPRDQWIIQLLVQSVLLGTYVIARLSRRTVLAAVGELERAVRAIAVREALLFEARAELERALRSGRGRFSDQTIGGYQLAEVLGRGAMGEVYAGVDANERPVAVKLLSQSSLGNRDHVLRFQRELRTAAGLVADNIVRVLDVGDSPVPYLVMGRLEGQTLAELLRTKKTLPPNELCDLVRQVGRGISVAAAAGIVHRDLKPQNVFLHGTTWKVLDFGVARAVDQGDTLTAGHIVGTPSYMAPEQAAGGRVDHLTDLYALAAIAYRALTGVPPFAAREVAETLYKVVHTSPRRPSEIVEVPGDVELVLAIGLAKRPQDRFGSASELAESLTQAFAGALPEDTRMRGLKLGDSAWSTRPSP